ncbi:MAG: translational GTPase TypA [Deltaproteobacteria bacterium]|nr:translational GTPase TypA [Deltaproteobacteria bacterium]
MKNIRNICIVAHVDHGKTTLVDYMLRQAGTFKSHEELSDRVMDSMDLERERGITIRAKNAAIHVKDAKINIVDTPGHADFGGEVERIIGMVDGALLLVDAAEGPLPQTRFVLEKALARGHKVILVINKVDRRECEDGSRIKEVVNQTFDLFVELGANEEQADFPIVYACARAGWCTTDFERIPNLISGKEKGSLEPLFDLILKTIPAPKINASADFSMMISNLAYSDYVGRLAIGRVISGSAKRNQKMVRKGINAAGSNVDENFTVTQINTFDGLKQSEVEELEAGDIGLISGSEHFEIGDTLAGSASVETLPRITVEKPTLGMLFSVNTSPFSGQEGEAIQSRKLRDRLLRECRQNVAIRFEETDQPDQIRLLGRGELQFAILIEQMRREGFEFMVGKPLVLFTKDEAGNRLEPFEKAVLDLPEEAAGDVTSLFQQRKGILTSYEQLGGTSSQGSKRVRLMIEIPTRGLLGVRSKYLTLTRGEGLFSTLFHGFFPYKGEILHRTSGSLIADRSGPTTEYAIRGLEDRGMFFFDPGVMVYEGMIVGEANKNEDINVNVCREKKLTNMRASHLEALVHLAGTRKMSLEDCLEWIEADEWIEITPKSIRIRKKILAQNMRSVNRGEDA